jgi:hypothetical protein
VKGLHDFSDRVDALVRINPDSSDDCLDKRGSKLGRSLHRVARIDDHAIDKTTFARNSCKIVVGQEVLTLGIPVAFCSQEYSVHSIFIDEPRVSFFSYQGLVSASAIAASPTMASLLLPSYADRPLIRF